MAIKNKRTKRNTVIATIAVALLVGGGAAFAYWTATGTGTGEAETGVAVDFVVTSSPATGDALSPGGPAQTVAFAVNNPGDGSQLLSDVTVTVANADGTAWTAVTGCSAADYTVSTPVITYGEIASGATQNGTVEVSMNNLPTNQDACQGVTVPLYFVAS